MSQILATQPYEETLEMSQSVVRELKQFVDWHCVYKEPFVATGYNHVMRIITSLSPNKLIIAYNVLTAMQLSLLVLYTMYGMPKDPTPSKLPSMCHFIRRWADPNSAFLLPF